ncbi:Glutamyl-tRNA [Spathaspora sp. JA1]|nr:Glutamyl-tRNA [Spathaspora sp. JA1]
MFRRFSTSVRSLRKLQLDPNYKFKCGLEIHTQLKTKYKLFSLSPTSFNEEPNSKISYFDIGLPGSQPKLNPEALHLALIAATAFNCDIQPFSTFDRKHYFYPDQPLGYQITQHYHPIAKNGFVNLNSKFDGIESDKTIRLEQVQIEQDTGKTVNFDDKITIDLNRSNTPLIEVVTKPDFEDIKQVRAFVKKYQMLVSHLGICSGDMETGAIRVDVNISINGNDRVEIKNLGSSGEIVAALEYEYRRQVEEISKGNKIIQETRGWNGTSTVPLRRKENALDYRYVPDSELEVIRVDEDIGKKIQATLPVFPDVVLERLTSEPYNLALNQARKLLQEPLTLKYYLNFFDRYIRELEQPAKSANNWVLEELVTSFAKIGHEFDVAVISPEVLIKIAKAVLDQEISLTAARILLRHLIEVPADIQRPLTEVIELLDLQKPSEISKQDLDEAITDLCKSIIEDNPQITKKIQGGQVNAVQSLIGKAMRETQGKIHAKEFKEKFSALLGIK